MATRISDALQVSHGNLEAHGAFDAFTDIDSHFHIHPSLLAVTTVPELADADALFKAHFTKIIVLLNGANNQNDILYRNAVKQLVFPEIPLAALGYAKDNTRGRAIGIKLADQIAETAFQIVKAGIKDPVIFELVGLFEEDVGSDLISDMTLWLIVPGILKFNERIVKNLNLKTIKTQVANTIQSLPLDADTGKPILLIPKDILSPLPVATSFDDIDTVCNYNDEVRDVINKRIGRTWGDARNKIHKRDIKKALLDNPALLKDLLEQYKQTPPAKYDYENDPLGELLWFEASREFAQQFPIKLKPIPDHTHVVQVVTQICGQYKRLIEQNGLFKLLYDQHESLKPERAAQLLFYGIADAYCAANNLDLSREPDAGRGPVDFKVSKGYNSRVAVEVKYSSNKRLAHGYETQLPIYNDAEKTFHSIYLVLQTTSSVSGIERIKALRAEAVADKRRAPEIIVIDATDQPSASHA
jgi:hypothetical protein